MRSAPTCESEPRSFLASFASRWATGPNGDSGWPTPAFRATFALKPGRVAPIQPANFNLGKFVHSEKMKVRCSFHLWRTSAPLAVFGTMMFLGVGSVQGQVQAHDDAAGYNAAGNVWTNGMNLGSGFVPWAILASGPGQQAVFVGDGGSIATTNNSAWGLHAFGTPTNLAVAFRGFSNFLPIGEAFKIKWRSGDFGTNGYSFAGVS